MSQELFDNDWFDATMNSFYTRLKTKMNEEMKQKATNIEEEDKVKSDIEAMRKKYTNDMYPSGIWGNTTTVKISSDSNDTQKINVQTEVQSETQYEPISIPDANLYKWPHSVPKAKKPIIESGSSKDQLRNLLKETYNKLSKGQAVEVNVSKQIQDLCYWQGINISDYEIAHELDMGTGLVHLVLSALGLLNNKESSSGAVSSGKFSTKYTGKYSEEEPEQTEEERFFMNIKIAKTKLKMEESSKKSTKSKKKSKLTAGEIRDILDNEDLSEEEVDEILQNNFDEEIKESEENTDPKIELPKEKVSSYQSYHNVVWDVSKSDELPSNELPY